MTGKSLKDWMTRITNGLYPVGCYLETSDTAFDPNVSIGGTWASETIVDDKIVSEGTSGYWTYRKWSSGRVEAWYYASFSVACTTASTAYGGYRSAAISIAIPSGIFPSTPTYAVAIKNGANAHQLKNMNIVSATGFECYFSNGAKETSTISLSIYAVLKPTTTAATINRWHRTA